MDRERICFGRIAFALKYSVFLLMLGLVLSFSYIEKVQNALKNASGKLNYHIGFIATQIFESNEKHVFFNWGFPCFVILGIVLLYFSLLSKEEATESIKLKNQ